MEEERSLNTYISHPYSYAFGKSTKTLLNDTLYTTLRKSANNFGNQLAIVSLHENIEKTFNQFHQDVNKFANSLRFNCDVRSGQVICIWTANTYFFVVVQYACAKLGAILSPINAFYKTNELLYALEKIKPRILILPGPNSPQEKNINNFAKIFDELIQLDEFRNVPIEHIVYLDENQQAGLLKKYGKTLRIHSAKNFLNDKYLDNCKMNTQDGKENTCSNYNEIKNVVLNEDNLHLNKINNRTTSNVNFDVNSNVITDKMINNIKTNSEITKANAENVNDCCITGVSLSNTANTKVNTNQTKKLKHEVDTSQCLKSRNKFEIYVDPDSPFALFFTSGTTGMPKAATLSHFSLCNNTRFFGERVGFKQYLKKFDTTARVCLPVPIFHAFGAILGTTTMTTCPVTIVLCNYRYDVESTISAIIRYDCTHVFCVPAMLIDLMDYVEENEIIVKSLNTVVTAAANVPLDVVKRFSQIVPSINDIQIVYGATESSPIITSPVLGSKMLDNLDNVGVPLDFAEVKLVDKTTKELVKLGEEGELLTRGPFVFLGYWGDEQQTKKCIKNNWYNTGDLAVMSSDGKIKIVGRTKEIIIRGGANIYPREIEEVLICHPLILNAYVCGYPHERLGEDICAWVKLRDLNKPLTEKEIKDYCKNKMAYFKVPRKVLFVNEFPMTQSGKIQKFRMKELTCEKLGINLN